MTISVRAEAPTSARCSSRRRTFHRSLFAPTLCRCRSMSWKDIGRSTRQCPIKCLSIRIPTSRSARHQSNPTKTIILPHQHRQLIHIQRLSMARQCILTNTSNRIRHRQHTQRKRAPLIRSLNTTLTRHCTSKVIVHWGNA